MKTINIVLFALGILSLVSCLENKKPSNELVLGVMPSMDYLPLAVAQREGYFEKVGLNIRFQKFYSANDRDAAFQSGNVDGVIIDYTGALLQRSGGIKLRITSKCDAPFYIVAGSQTGIESLYQLKGRKVAVSQNTVIDYCVDMALKSVLLNSQDIEKIEINKIPVRFEMLRNNKIDVTGLPNPFALMAEDAGDKVLTSNAELGFSITGIMFSEKTLETKADMIKKMYEAYNMGIEYLKAHKVTNIQDILIKEFAFSESIVSKAALSDYTIASMPTDKDIESVANWLIDRKLIDASFDRSSVLDNRFVK